MMNFCQAREHPGTFTHMIPSLELSPSLSYLFPVQPFAAGPPTCLQANKQEGCGFSRVIK